jgi:hypothetical protein
LRWKMAAQSVSSSCRERIGFYVASSANIDLLKWNGTPLVLAPAQVAWVVTQPRLESLCVRNSGSGSANCFLKSW